MKAEEQKRFQEERCKRMDEQNQLLNEEQKKSDEDMEDNRGIEKLAWKLPDFIKRDGEVFLGFGERVFDPRVRSGKRESPLFLETRGTELFDVKEIEFLRKEIDHRAWSGVIRDSLLGLF
ncbi:hypothetical protein TNCV_3475862 [Trichonephila clavipes]|nr:hypothetical protein TNCV_3475862 [Trichonephila clavipes]